MPNLLIGDSFTIIAVLVFVAVTLLLEGVVQLWRSHRNLRRGMVGQRLQELKPTTAGGNVVLLRGTKLTAVPRFERLLRRMPHLDQVVAYLTQANLDWTVSRLLLSCATGGLASLLLGALAGLPALPTLMLAGVGATAPLLYAHQRRAQRLSMLAAQLPEALDLLGRALRAGNAFSAGLKMVGDELPEPISGEFRLVHEEIRFGEPLEKALLGLSMRVPLTELRYFVVAVLIQRESGGNLTELLANLSRLLRERARLHGQIRILSAEGRLSAWVLGVLPFLLGALLAWANPRFMAPLWRDPIGIAIVRTLLVMMVIGILVLWKIVRIRV